MKKLTFSQGKLLIKLINRETDSSSYELVKSFMGSFKAFFYQGFAAMFGASLKKEYHPDDEDALIERIIIQIDNGQL
jgi:phosphate starvation-inducible membrane PsiE